MFDLITIGSATLDIIVKSNDFSLAPLDDGKVALCQIYGGKVDVQQFKMTSGGGATNVAVGASRLGLHVATVCEVGKDFPAQIILDDLEKERVVSEYVISERLEETAVSVLLVAKEGGRSIMTHRGAAYELESRDIPWEILPQTRWVHLGSLGGDKQLIFDLFEFFHEHEVGNSWNPGKKDLEVLTSNVIQIDHVLLDVLILNDEEWQMIESLHKQLLSQVKIIIVTAGSKGGDVYVDGQKVSSFQAQEVKAVEETGAGDAFASGVISALLQGQPLPKCIDWGIQNASNVIQYLGAKEGLLRKEEISS